MISDARLNQFCDWLSRQPVIPPDEFFWARARRNGFSDVGPAHLDRVIYLLKRRAAGEFSEADALEKEAGPVSIYPPGEEAQAFRRADEIMLAAGNACDWDLQDALLRLEQAKEMILKEIRTKRVVEGYQEK